MGLFLVLTKLIKTIITDAMINKTAILKLNHPYLSSQVNPVLVRFKDSNSCALLISDMPQMNTAHSLVNLLPCCSQYYLFC